MSTNEICHLRESCSGCQNWGMAQSEQLEKKVTLLRSRFLDRGLKIPEQIEIVPLPDRGLRDRLDFQIRERAIGLLDSSRSQIVDIDRCLQLSPRLQLAFDRFRAHPLPNSLSIKKGSFRLRVAPDGTSGVWLDFANEDVRDLMQEKYWLRKLLTHSKVEIGQRRKALYFTEEDEPALSKSPQFYPWTKTWIKTSPKTKEFPLLSRIADFSQTGEVANEAIVRTIEGEIKKGQHLVEFGSGNGNLTFAVAHKFDKVSAYEFDSYAVEAFRANHAVYQQARPSAIELFHGDFQKKKIALAQADSLLLNPPRSGVGGFLTSLKESRIENLVYMSCYPKTLVEDISRGLGPPAEGWSCRKLVLIDQFPQTDHMEVISFWHR